MRGNNKVIAALNDGLKAELTAINQYFLHGEMCQNWGYYRLYQHTKKSPIEETKPKFHLAVRTISLIG